MRPWKELVIGVAAIALSSGALAAGLEDLGSEPEAAREFDYCLWGRQEGGSTAALPDLDSILEGGGPGATEEQIAAAALIKAGVEIVRASSREQECRQAFAKGRQRFDKLIEGELRQWRGRTRYEPSTDEAVAAAQERISRQWAEDQAARMAYVALRSGDRPGAELWARQLSAAHATLVDARSTRLMQELLEAYDWIDNERFGIGIANHAWLLVQHADDHPGFQALVLSRMEPYLEKGGVKPSNYAFLWDRVAVNTGRKQRYGTQPIWECHDGRLELQPLEQPEDVNERRAAMGMGRVEEGLAEMERSYCR